MKRRFIRLGFCALLSAAAATTTTAVVNARPVLRTSESLVLHPRLVQKFAPVQESFPAPPADKSLVYWRGEREGALAPLPLEAGASPLDMRAVAGSDRMSRLELRGEHAPLVVNTFEPHFFLFVEESAHPPLLVRLEARRGARRVAVMAQKGQRGFAIASAEIVKPHYRVLAREGGILYMEVWGRELLQPGEYAFIGSDLARIATFSVRESAPL